MMIFNRIKVKGDKDAKDELYRQFTAFDPNDTECLKKIEVDVKEIEQTPRQYHNLVKLAGDVPNDRILDLNNIIPIEDDSYSNRLKTWGASEIFGSEIENDTYYMATNWTPIGKVVKSISEQYPELTLDYFFDDGSTCCGRSIHGCGQEIYNSSCENFNSYEEAYVQLDEVEEYMVCEDCGIVTNTYLHADKCPSCKSKKFIYKRRDTYV